MPLPMLGEALPARGNRLSRGLGKTILRGLGWDFEGEIPNLSKMVVIAAPHTSNWDFVVAIATVLALGLQVHWIGKHTIFRPPFGWLMRWLGGTPVDRSKRHGLVAQVVALFVQHERFVFGVAPEGTRKRVDRWKTGFYHVAVGAQAPILPAYLDFPRKRVGVGPLVTPSGDLEADMQTIQTFYAQFTGKNPEQF
ncbi:MAG: lysophospholipid acyltransferase family protein [Rhodothermales bacterium]